MTEWHRVTVLYKSGNQITFYTDRFSVKHNPLKVEWGTIKPRSPRPLLFGLDHIEAIWYE